MRLLLIALGLISCACSFAIGERRPTTPMKTYMIIIKEGNTETQKEILADRITESNGCVLFWRGKTLDTVLCEHMARTLVTEKN